MSLQRFCSTSMINFFKLSSSSSSSKFLSFPIQIPSSSSSIPPPLFIPLTRRTRPFSASASAATTTASAAGTGEKEETGTFFAEESVSWTSLGVSDKISRALSNIGLTRPSLVQAASIPCILVENDVVVAAETGSGKTHGYLVPLFHKLCETLSNSVDGGELTKSHQLSLVLCPNVTLCEQVVRMANCICNDRGEPLLKVAAVCGRQGWPVREPDIIVSTPAALLNYLYAIDPERRRRSDFIRGVKHVVFDEADMLLCGSFQNQVIRLINMLRFDEKLLSRGKKFVVEEPLDPDSESIMQLDLEVYEDMKTNSIQEEDGDAEIDADIEKPVERPEAEVKKKKDWKRARKVYERSKQYIFVAATLPENGKMTAGGVLKRMFPDARWVSGTYLHCHNPRCISVVSYK